MAPAALTESARMPLLLKRVEPARGAGWFRDAFALFVRRPLAFTLMFVTFLATARVVTLVPLLGNLVLMMSAPLLSLGFMVAAQSALLDGVVRPTQFIEPLRTDPARRRALLALCLLYGLAVVLITLVCYLMVSAAALERIEALAGAGEVSLPELLEALDDPSVHASQVTALILGALLSVPFWHAPALVHWGEQGVGQALFSSTLAVWRSRGAFTVYGLIWAGLCILLGLVAVVIGLVVALPLGLMLTTVFYISLLFTFNDSFGGTESPP
jgi:hypothetical protein